jgi:pimeloyl-ACP methyl ester carboxylesterase
MKSITYKGVSVTYKVSGVADNVLVLLHGFCETHAIWNAYSSKLSKSNIVIAIDLLGFGGSGSLGELNSMEDNAAAVNEVLKACKVKKASIIGHSMGGYVALAFAEAFPKKLSKIVLFHSTAFADSEEKKKDRMRAIEVVRKSAALYAKGLVENLFYKDSYMKFAKKVNEIDLIAKKSSAEAIIGALAGMSARKDRSAILEKMDVSVLFIFGKQDNVLPLEKVLPQISMPKHAEVLILDKVGHMGFIEADKACLKVISDFVD